MRTLEVSRDQELFEITRSDGETGNSMEIQKKYISQV